MKLTSFKEIVTKAVIGKCKKNNTLNELIECEEKPNTVLGCWVINHTFSGKNYNGKVNLNGSFDINLWYSYDNDTKTSVTSKKINYNDIINVPLKNDSKIDDKSEIYVECLKQPTVTNVDIKDGLISVKIEKELGISVIGNEAVKVAVEDNFDDYEEIFDTEEEKELDINIDELDDNFIEENSNGVNN